MTNIVDRQQPVNALRQLMAGYLTDHRSESYASIGRRGSLPSRPLPRSTVHSLATKPQLRQTPQVSTLEALARGMDMSEDVVRRAAADAAGYPTGPSLETNDGGTYLIVEAMQHLDDERMDLLARRARLLLAEMREEQQARN